MPPPYARETVLGLLDQHHLRATYSAIGALLGVLPRSVMRGLPREPRYSWVVAVESGRPSEYDEAQVHPDLEEHPEILTTMDQLLEWLEAVEREGKRKSSTR
jgi:hypothetical protein